MSTSGNGQAARQGAIRATPINKCIYCGFTSPNPSDLSKEHVLPKGLGGADTLLKASCKKCSSKTAEVERVCIRGSFWTLRSLQGHRSGFKIPDSDRYGVFPVFQPPSILFGLDNRRHRTLKLFVLTATISGKLPPNAEMLASKYTVAPPTFCQLIAKIAHGYCIRRFGLGSFEPLLPPIILGEVTHLPDIWHYVGGWPEPVDAGQPHYLGIHTLKVEEQLFLGVTLRLFVRYGLPAYHLIVGKVSHDIASQLPPGLSFLRSNADEPIWSCEGTKEA